MLNLKGKVKIIEKFAEDFEFSVEAGLAPQSIKYKIQDSKEDLLVEASARRAFYLSSLNQDKPLVKVAFDTRKVNPELERNPRNTLQHYHRADEFIDTNDQKRIEIFSKLIRPINEIKSKYEADPDWHDSYARLLHDNLNKTLIVKESDVEVFRPQMEYLSQILYLRYRLTMEDISKMSSEEIKDIILKKDERLMKKGAIVKEMMQPKESNNKVIIKDGDKTNTQESIINAIFGNNNIRRDGEKTVERTITITIKDTVLD
jgi:hypothetical protein